MGIDLGGTKIASIVIDGNTHETIATEKVPTPDNYGDLLVTLTELVTTTEAQHGRVSVGMCHPGSTLPSSGLIHNSNTLYLNGKAFVHDVEKHLKRRIAAGNDANCFTLSEAVDGAAQDATVVFGATLGTGLGGGVVVEKRIIAGLNGLGGEWGHTNLPWQSPDELKQQPACYCGLKGCLETFLSGTGLANDYAYHQQKQLKGEAIVALAEQGDADAEACLQRYEHRLARACAMVINILDPDVIVLGGGLSSLPRLYTNVPKQWNDYIFSSVPVKTKLVKAQFGGESGRRGAAWLGATLPQ